MSGSIALAIGVVAGLSAFIKPRLKPPPPLPPAPQQIDQAAEAARVAGSLHQLRPPLEDFVGREEELAELLRAVEQRGATISGVRGMGGVGKTELALVLADRLKDHYPDAQIFLDMKGASAEEGAITEPLSAADAMAHVIQSYRPEAKLPESEGALSGLYHSVLDGQSALLLMDNAREAAQVEPLIPPKGCVLLVTSRWHFTLPGLKAKNLNALPPDDARKLLLKIGPRIKKHAEEVARLCGYLPLALRVTGSAIAEHPDLDLADTLRRLGDGRERLQLTGAEASLSLSYDLLPPEQQALWRALAVFPGDFDPAGAAAVWGMEPDPAREALSELRRYSLVEWNEKTRRYRLHDLARDFADARLPDPERERAEERHAAHYKDILRATRELYEQGGEAMLRGLALLDLERANIEAGQAWAAAHAATDPRAAELAEVYPDAGAYVLDLRLHPREHIRWLEAALAAARKLKRRQAEANRLGNLGIAYAGLGETRKAIEYYEQALAIHREIGDRRGEGAALGNLGSAGQPRPGLRRPGRDPKGH